MTAWGWWGAVLAIVGATLTFASTFWLWNISAEDPDLVDDGMLYPGRQVSRAVPALVRKQRTPLALGAVGAILQIAGAILVLINAIQTA